MALPSLEDGFMLGDCEIRPAEHCIEREGDTHHIEPKSMAVLLELAASAPETVSRDSLNAAVWPRGYVTDDALNRCISQLRHALGDQPKSPRFIVTVTRKGYRLVAQVVLANPIVSGQELLVLPFQHLSASGEDGYLSDSLTELLIARLSVALEQPVISRTTAMSFRNTDRDLASIAEQLGVRWVVEGSLMLAEDQLQTVVQLIDAATDTHVWAETWSRPIGDALAVINEVSRLVSGQISSHLGPEREPKEDLEYSLPPDALRHYLHGIQLNSQRTHESLWDAIGFFEKVLKHRPDFAPALTGVAMSNILLAHYGAIPVKEGFTRGRDLAEQALKLDPGLADAKLHLAAIKYHYDWDFEGARKIVEEALTINPNLEMGLILLANCQIIFDQSEHALNCVSHAEAMDPLNSGLLMNAGDHLILQQRYQEAIRSLTTAIELNPAFRPAILRLALAHALNDDPRQARICLERAVELGGQDRFYLEFVAITEGQAGNWETAVTAASQLEAMSGQGMDVLPWSQARAWASAGDADKAIEYLLEAYETRSSSMPFLGKTPIFNPIRHLPEVRALMEKVGLPI